MVKQAVEDANSRAAMQQECDALMQKNTLDLYLYLLIDKLLTVGL